MNSGERRDRGEFDQRLARSIERARRYPGFHYAVVSVDLGLRGDGDATCVPDGDGLLEAAVSRLEACLRVSELPPTLRHGDLVVHLHDDTLAVLLDGLKEISHAAVAAERILAELSMPFAVVPGEVRLSVSTGVA